MGIRRLQGWALVIAGLIGLLSIIGSNSSIFKILFIIGALLLTVGAPAIESLQRSGTLGWVGIALIELAALAALALNLMASGASMAETSAIPLGSALAGALGRVIVGWLTTRARVFPAWAGWAFIAEGVLNFLGGILAASMFT